MNTLARRPLWLAIGWGLVALVTVLSLMPSVPLPEVDHGDKLGHVLAYFSLAAWFGEIYGARPAVALPLLAMGATLEILQGMTGYRDMSLYDMLANATGVAVGWLFARHMPDLLRKLESRLP